MFTDTATINVKAGDGGNGALSFRKEKYISKGGPDGGDGGKGGSVIAVGEPNIDGLTAYRYQKTVAAGDGGSGGKRRLHGKNGADTFLKVPLGTQLWENETLLGDITEAGQQLVIARGGRGGYGNAHFTSSVRQAPRIAELGEPGEERQLRLELKLIADIGLIGLPNAGKSTFLSVVSGAHPKIADYPFTTLSPNLGVAKFDGSSLVIADIPGLIEGAAEGKGLGHEFLRHVERTAVLLHLIDVTGEDVVRDYQTIQQELAAYSPILKKRPQLIVLTKTDALDSSNLQARVSLLEKKLKKHVFAISSVRKDGTLDLLRELHATVITQRTANLKHQTSGPTIPVLTLDKKENTWKITKSSQGFVVTGHKIERFALRTDMSEPAGERRIRDILRKMGIMHELARKGAEKGDLIQIGRVTLTY
jgi:GTP-binding protein